MSSAIRFNLDQSKILSSGNRLSYIAAASAHTHAFQKLLLQALTMVSSERQMNPVALTILTLWREIGQAREQASDPLFSYPVCLGVNYHGAAIHM